MVFEKFGFEVKQILLGWRARHMQVDNRLGLGGVHGFLDSEWRT